MSILIIDDEPILQDVLTSLLRNEGFTTLSATTGQEGLAILAKEDVDLVLLMSVNPGYGGQSYVSASTDKIRRLREMLDAIGSTADLEVDGGIKTHNAAQIAAAGANVLVTGSAIFGGPNSIAENITAFRQALADS